MTAFIINLRNPKDSKDRKAFLNSKHGVKRKIKTAYEKYLLDILGLDGESGEQNQAFSRKKLFSFLKSSKSDAQGIALLKRVTMSVQMMLTRQTS